MKLLAVLISEKTNTKLLKNTEYYILFFFFPIFLHRWKINWTNNHQTCDPFRKRHFDNTQKCFYWHPFYNNSGLQNSLCAVLFLLIAYNFFPALWHFWIWVMLNHVFYLEIKGVIKTQKWDFQNNYADIFFLFSFVITVTVFIKSQTFPLLIPKTSS